MTYKQQLANYEHINKSNTYLSMKAISFHIRTAITRLWTSNHNLKIETGRYNLPILPVNERICFNCPDELHFLFNFPAYQASNEFTNLLKYIYIYILSLNGFFNDLTDKWTYISSLEDQNLNYLLAKFVVKDEQFK